MIDDESDGAVVVAEVAASAVVAEVVVPADALLSA